MRKYYYFIEENVYKSEKKNIELAENSRIFMDFHFKLSENYLQESTNLQICLIYSFCYLYFI